MITSIWLLENKYQSEVNNNMVQNIDNVKHLR
jgi:hypothetical protein